MSASTMATALAQLQDEVSNCEQALLKLIETRKMTSEKITSEKPMETQTTNAHLQQTPIAIIGMASIFPQSRNIEEYWTNILNKVDCITDVPPSRWNVEDYYDPDPRTPDKTYCKRGGFIPDLELDLMEFGLPPSILEATDTSQLLSLVIAKEAMEDAGYGESREFSHERTGVILGAALARQLGEPLGARLQYPVWEKVLKSSGLSDEDTQKLIEKMKLAYVQWEENSFPGLLANVIAGRIANRLDFGGTNCVVDAACASSLGALSMAISELNERRCDMMLTGGVDPDNSIFSYICFSKTPAVTKSENVKPFDADSDGMMLGEGIGMLVLKRLEDAERDGDRIYAVIKGVGTSSDGRFKSIYAPRPEGQVRALRGAYERAGVAPASIGLIEAHGTGTNAGDPTEFSAIKDFFSESNAGKQQIAIGSVKSQIGHTKAAAGAASLIKTALALHHKVLPATINVAKPHPKLGIDDSPCYLNTETRPWLRQVESEPRRAGVSSFGFGGTNYHVVLEEYESEHDRAYRLHNCAETVLLFAPTPEELLTRCEYVLDQLQSNDKDQYYAELINCCKSLEIPAANARVGFVANSLAEARNLLQTSIDWIRNKAQAESWEHPQGIYYRKTGISPQGKVVALFSGQGSQYLEMGRELAINFPDLRKAYSYVDSLLSKDGLKPLSETVFPRPVFDKAQKNAQAEALQRTEYAQPAIGVLSFGLYKILQQAGFKPDFVAGHSFGELTALWAAEVLSDEDYFFLVKARGQAMAAPEDPNFDAGAMLAVKGNVSKVEEVVKNFSQVTIANLNSSNQIVLAGTKPEIAKVQETLNKQGFSAILLPVSAAFHTPLVGHAQKPFAQAIEQVTFKKGTIPAYTNVTGKRYPSEPDAIQNILKTHLLNSVFFKDEIENIYAEGGYFFIEFGPRNILTNLVKETLGNKPHLAVALNPSRQEDSDRQVRKAAMQLRVAGLPLKNLDPYKVAPKAPKPKKKKALNVQINGHNYVSEKTKMAFEKALQDGYKVKATVNTPEATPSSPVMVSASMTTNVDISQVKPAVVATQKTPAPVVAQPAPAVVATQKTPELKIQPKPEELPVMNYQRVLDSLEYTLAQFNQHQSDLLHVHEQSLTHQIEYAKTFFHLMHQQQLLFGNGKSAHQNGQIKPVVLESAERSIMRFHDHQAETLRIHGQYLSYQMEYAKNFFQLIQQQYKLLTTDGSIASYAISTQVAAPVVSYQDSPVVPTVKETTHVKQESPILTTAPVAVPAKEVVPSRELVFSNGSSNGSKKDLKPVQESLVTSAPSINDLAPAQPEPIATLTAASPVAIDFAALSQTLLSIVSEKTGYPTEMLELDMDIEADLGIDSIKRVEILGALQEIYPDLPKPENPEELAEKRTLGQIVDYIRTLNPATPQALPASVAPIVEAPVSLPVPSPELIASNHVLVPASPAAVAQPESTVIAAPLAVTTPVDLVASNGSHLVPASPAAVAQLESTATVADLPLTDIDFAELSQTLLSIVSEKTGYPTEMLELDMDIEADLGIDSIKRVEILGALQEIYPNLPKPENPEELAEQRTLGQIVGYIEQTFDAKKKLSLSQLSLSPSPLSLVASSSI